MWKVSHVRPLHDRPIAAVLVSRDWHNFSTIVNEAGFFNAIDPLRSLLSPFRQTYLVFGIRLGQPQKRRERVQPVALLAFPKLISAGLAATLRLRLSEGSRPRCPNIVLVLAQKLLSTFHLLKLGPSEAAPRAAFGRVLPVATGSTRTNLCRPVYGNCRPEADLIDPLH